jgi:hypothetical protein
VVVEIITDIEVQAAGQINRVLTVGAFDPEAISRGLHVMRAARGHSRRRGVHDGLGNGLSLRRSGLSLRRGGLSLRRRRLGFALSSLSRLRCLLGLRSRPLRFALGRSKLLLCIAQLALKLSQFPLQVLNLPLDRVDPIYRSRLRKGADWCCGN